MKNNKADLFLHLDKMIIGSVTQIMDSPRDSNFVDIWYKPLNTFKTVQLDRPINKTHLHDLRGTELHIPGVESRIVCVFTDEPGSIISRIFKSQERAIETLREELRTLKGENSNLKQQNKKYAAATSQVIAEKRGIDKNSNNNNQFNSPLGRVGRLRQF